MAEANEFYVGYLPKAPRGIGRLVTRVTAGLIGLAIGVAAVATAAQNRPGPGVAEDVETMRRGVLVARPYPVLFVEEAGKGARGVMLVAQGKHGLLEPADFCGPGETVPVDPGRAEMVAALRAADGMVVAVRGLVIAREGREMLEVTRLEGVDQGATATAVPASEDLGVVDVVGEITDPKCYFGLMKPGEGQTHRACAIRCVAGGITPVLTARDGGGRLGVYVLTDSAGKPANQLVRGWVAEGVRVKGRLTRRGDVLFLAVEAGGIGGL